MGESLGEDVVENSLVCQLEGMFVCVLNSLREKEDLVVEEVPVLLEERVVKEEELPLGSWGESYLNKFSKALGFPIIGCEKDFLKLMQLISEKRLRITGKSV